MVCLQAKGQVQATQQAGTENRALRQANGGLGKALAEIIRKMANAVDEVESERKAEEEFDATLDDKGEGSKRRDETGALKVEAGEGGNQVRREVDVGDARHGAAGDSGPGGGAEPGLLHLVDAEMGGDGTTLALVDEDLVSLVVGELGGLGEAAKERKCLLASNDPLYILLSSSVRNGVCKCVVGRCNLPSLCGRDARSHGQLGHVLAKHGRLRRA